MENIGQLLKERREELGYSIAEMSAKIKISENRLEAIEAGDLNFFKNELSYLTYYLRYYCKALYIDFDVIRDNLDHAIVEYEHTLAINKTKVHEAMTQNIKTKAKESGISDLKNNPNYRNLKVKRKKSKFDSGMAAFLSLALVAVLVLGFVFFNNILPNLGNNGEDDPTVTPPITNNPTDPTDPDDKPTEPDDEDLVLSIVREGSSTYVVSNYNAGDTFTLSVEFVSKSWFTTTYTDAAQKIFETKTYEKGSKDSITITADTAQTFTIRFGYYKGSKISINGTELAIDESQKEIEVITFTIEFKGANE